MRDTGRARDLILVHRVRDEDDDEEQFKPLDWRLIRRLSPTPARSSASSPSWWR